MTEPPSSPTGLDVDVEQREGGCRVRVAGELDAATANDLESALAEAAATGDLIEVDLGGVTFIDSSGLRALLVSQQSAADAGGALVIGAMTPAVDRLLDLTGLRETFAKPSA